MDVSQRADKPLLALPTIPKPAVIDYEPSNVVTQDTHFVLNVPNTTNKVFKDGQEVEQKPDAEELFVSEEQLQKEGDADFSLMRKASQRQPQKRKTLAKIDFKDELSLPSVNEEDDDPAPRPPAGIGKPLPSVPPTPIVQSTSSSSRRPELPQLPPEASRSMLAKPSSPSPVSLTPAYHHNSDDWVTSEEPDGVFFTPYVGRSEDFQKYHVEQTQGGAPNIGGIALPQSLSFDSLKSKFYKLKSSISDDSISSKDSASSGGGTIKSSSSSSSSASGKAAKPFSPPQLLASASKALLKQKGPDEHYHSGSSHEELPPAPRAIDPELFDAKGVLKGNDTIVTYEEDKPVMISKVVHGKPQIEAATIKVLIEKLANEEAQDHDYMRIFLLTFRHVLKPIEFLELLVQRLKMEMPANPTPQQQQYFEKWAWKIQYRVINFVKKWMESCWYDFHNEPKMLATLAIFIRQAGDSPKVKNLAPQLEQTIKKQTEMAIAEERKAAEKRKIELTVTISSTTTFVSLNPVSVARQLTLIEFEQFRKIQPQELMVYLWGDPREKKETDLTVNLTGYVNRFNKISFWVGTEICTVPQIKKRVQIVEKFIQVIKVLRELNNFNTLMAIVAGLNHSSVQRLKKTWEALSSRSHTILKEVETLMTPAGNYAAYRDIEKRKYPYFIPFFGLMMKDLIFANDGNPKKLEDGLINFGKLRFLANAVQRIMIFQSNPYDLETEPAYYSYCDKPVYIQDEARLYKYSLLCEPRASGENEPSVRLVDKWTNETEKLTWIERWTKDL